MESQPQNLEFRINPENSGKIHDKGQAMRNWV